MAQFDKIKYFCEHYKTILTKESRVKIAKRLVKDNSDLASFNEDIIGWVKLDGDLCIIEALHHEIELDRELENVKGIDKDNKDIDNHIINIPHFIKNLDLIKYEDYDGDIVFAVAFISDKSWIENYAYCVKLDYDKIMSFSRRKKKSFDEDICFYLHDHPHYTIIDVVDAKSIPPEYKKAYEKFIRLYNRFYKR